MKWLLKVSAFVVLVTVINVVSLVVLVGPITSTAGPPEASENGDVNGDQAINIADMIYLVDFLFRGGPPPVAIAGDPVLEELASHLSVEFLDDGQGGRNLSTSLRHLTREITVPRPVWCPGFGGCQRSGRIENVQQGRSSGLVFWAHLPSEAHHHEFLL